MALFFVGLVGWSSKKSDGEWPARPVKVVVPFAAGGGSDSFARQLILVIQDKGLFRQPMVVINVEGAGGTIGSRRVRNARPDGYTMLMLHEGILTAHYSGSVSYGPEAFQAVAGTGRMAMVIAVRDDSPIRNLKQAMVDWPIQGRPLNFAVNMGAPSHFAGLILEKSRVGVAFNFVQFGGGANRFAALTGGHADLSIFSVEEFLRYQGGGLRALAVLSPERHPAIPQVKTAREQGFDLVYSSMHFWWMPKGTPAAVCDRMADVIEEAMATTEMKKNLAESSTEPVILRGEALAGELRKRDGEISGVSLRKSAVLPNFPFWMMVATVLLIPFIVWNYLARSPSEETEEGAEEGATRSLWSPLSLGCYLLTGAYVLLLGLNWTGYPLVTAVFIFTVGGVIRGWRRSSLLSLAIMATATAFGLFYLFTRVLVVDLPG